ncbi:unannotated protein [freshwater metagenome]|uniref:Unannotated protein n=1 Tax=freshwater metagenome TaxID=449393 RepID=A0A6J7H859_9ZZZZ
MVAVRIFEYLADRGGFRTDVQGEQRRPASRGAGADEPVLGEERLQLLLPVRPVVQVVERVPLTTRRQIDPSKDRVTGQDSESPWIRRDRTRRIGPVRLDQGFRFSTGIGQVLPLVEQAGIDLPNELAQPLGDVLDLLGARFRRNRLAQSAVRVGEVAQYQALRAHEAVVTDQLREGHRALDHVTDDGLGRQAHLGEPRVRPAVDLEGRNEQLGKGFRPGDLFEEFHPLVVLDAVGLHLGHRFAACGMLLRHQHLAGIVERRLDDRHHVERVGGGVDVEQLERGHRERRQRLIEREVRLQVHRQPGMAPVRVRLGQLFDDSGLHQAAVQRQRTQDVLALSRPGLVVVLEQMTHRVEAIARPRNDIEQHRIADREPGRQRLRARRDDALERRLAPGYEAVGCLLALYPLELLRVVTGFGHEPRILDVVLGCLDHDGAEGVVPRAARASRDLMELARSKLACSDAVVFGESGEQHGPDGNVDAHAQRVGTADHLQQTVLRQFLHQPAVLGKHAGVMHPDTVTNESGQRRPEAGGEAEVADGLGYRGLLLLGRDIDARQGLSAFECRCLGEVHDVHRRQVRLHQLLDRFADRGGDVREHQRDRPFGTGDDGGRAAGASGQIVAEERDVAQRRRHEQELGVRQFDQRYLPGPPPVRLGVVVELVHDHLADVGVGALPQCQVRDDLGSGADDRRTGIDRRVAGHHADVLRSEDLAQGEELLADERLDRRGVETANACGHGREVGTDGDHGLSGTGRRGQDDVGSRHQLDQRLFLRGIQRQAPVRSPGGERVEQDVRVHAVGGGGGNVGYQFGEEHLYRLCVGDGGSRIDTERLRRERQVALRSSDPMAPSTAILVLELPLIMSSPTPVMSRLRQRTSSKLSEGVESMKSSRT